MAPKIKNPTLPATYTDFLTNYEQYKPVGTKPWHTGATSFDAIIANNDKIANSPAANSQIGIPDSPQISAPGAATAPGAVPPTVADTKTPYEIWMEQYGQQAQLMPAQSYGDWLVAGGMAGAAQKAYNDAVRAAETDYEKSKAMYGANAEALGRAGLTGSGYGDYLTGAGFSAMQGAKVAAADTKALTEAQQRSDYASYLMGVQQTNAQLQAQADAANRQSYAQYLALGGEAKGVVDQKMLAGESDEAIKAYIQQHYGNQFDSQLDGWITDAHAYNDAIIAENVVAKTEAETEAADAESLARAQAAYSALLAGYQDGAIVNVDTANAELKRVGFTQEEIDKALAEYSESTIQRLRTNMNISGAALADVPTSAYIDDLVTTGQITQAQADAFKDEVQAKRVELLDKKYDDLTNENAPDFISQIYGFYKSGDLSREKYAEYVGNLVSENIASIADDKSVKEPAVEVAALISDIKNSDAYNDIEDELLKKIADSVNVSVGKYFVSIVFDVGGKKETIQLQTGLDSDEEKAAVIQNLGTGPKGTIKEFNDTLYINYSPTHWIKVTGVSQADAGSPEYASIIYDLLLTKYKK